MHICLCTISFPGARVTDSFKLSGRRHKWNLGLQEEQSILLIGELCLQFPPQIVCTLYVSQFYHIKVTLKHFKHLC